jgi:uncharacterized protein (TIRG00374 family)
MSETATAEIPNRRRLAVRNGIRVLLAAGILALVLYLVDLDEVQGALVQVSALDIALLVLISVLLIGVSVVKWRAFLSHLGISASFEKLFGLYLVGYFVNIFTPSFIGGDVVRSLALGSSINRAHAVSATFLERYTGIVAMLAMAAVSVCFTDVVTTPIVLVVCLAVVGCAIATGLVMAGVVQKLATLCRLPQKVLKVIDTVHEGLVFGMRDTKLLQKAFVLSLVFHLLTIVNTAAVGHAVGWTEIPWRGLLVVVPLILLVGAVPVSPQGLGIQEGAFVFFLHSVGATTGQALAIALVLRAKSYLLAVCGALVWWFRKDAWARESGTGEVSG